MNNSEFVNLVDLLTNLPSNLKGLLGLEDDNTIRYFVGEMENTWDWTFRDHLFFEHGKFNPNTVGYMNAIKTHFLPLLSDYPVQLVKIAVFHRYLQELRSLTKYRIISPFSLEDTTSESGKKYVANDLSRNTRGNYGLCMVLAILNDSQITLGKLRNVFSFTSTMSAYSNSRSHDTVVDGVHVTKLIELFIDKGLIALEDLLLSQLVMSREVPFEQYLTTRSYENLPKRLYPVDKVRTEYGDSISGGFPYPIIVGNKVNSRLEYCPFNELMMSAPAVAYVMRKENRLNPKDDIILSATISMVMEDMSDIMSNSRIMDAQEYFNLYRVFNTPMYNRYGNDGNFNVKVSTRYRLPIHFHLALCLDAVAKDSPLDATIKEISQEYHEGNFRTCMDSFPRNMAQGILSTGHLVEARSLYNLSMRSELYKIGNRIIKNDIPLPRAKFNDTATIQYNLTTLIRTLKCFVSSFDQSMYSKISTVECYEERLLLTTNVIRFLRVHEPFSVLRNLEVQYNDIGIPSGNCVLNEDILTNTINGLEQLSSYIKIPLSLHLLLEQYGDLAPMFKSAFEELFTITRVISLKIVPNILISVGTDSSKSLSLGFALSDYVKILFCPEHLDLITEGNETPCFLPLMYSVHKAIFEDFDYDKFKLDTEVLYNNLNETPLYSVQPRLSEKFMLGENKSSSYFKFNYYECMFSPTHKVRYLEALRTRQRLDTAKAEELLEDFRNKTFG